MIGGPLARLALTILWLGTAGALTLCWAERPRILWWAKLELAVCGVAFLANVIALTWTLP